MKVVYFRADKLRNISVLLLKGVHNKNMPFLEEHSIKRHCERKTTASVV
jgi:hypothetical protein